MKEVFYINGKDAYSTWGITMDTTSLSALMAPPPVKAFVESKSRLQDGKQVVLNNPRLDERDLTLTLQLTARTEAQFFERYASFCEELKTGWLEVRTCYQPSVLYRFVYLSCQQFTQFVRGYAKFALKLTEPDPSRRALTE